jgi:hypothetical protein
MKRFLVLVFIMAALLSCKDDLTKIRKRNLIPREKFVEILVGIHMVDVMTNGPNFTRKYEPGDTVDLNLEVFEKYHVTQAEFDSTVAMYIRQPDVYLKVYDEVLLKLNYMLDTLKNNSPKFYREAVEE